MSEAELSILRPERAKITGVVLAGGLARRMGGGDKGLMRFRGRPLVTYALDALAAVSGRILISANRNHEVYGKFGYPVIADASAGFDGPLAGILSALDVAETPFVVVLPCDSPLIEGRQLQKLVSTLVAENADICAAHDGERLHPVFLALRAELRDSLADFLAGGERRIDRWINQHRLVLADFSDQPEIFRNVNTLDELAALEANHG